MHVCVYGERVLVQESVNSVHMCRLCGWYFYTLSEDYTKFGQKFATYLRIHPTSPVRQDH